MVGEGIESEISRGSEDRGMAWTAFRGENRFWHITRGVAWVKCRTVALPSDYSKPRDARHRGCIPSLFTKPANSFRASICHGRNDELILF